PRGPAVLRLAARASGEGTLDAGWSVIDLAHGTTSSVGSPESMACEGERGSEVEGLLPLPAGLGLLELRLAWRAPAGGPRLEVTGLELQESSSTPRPSVVLIVIDTLSARHLSSYGYPLETDPELRRFASESFLFEHCFSNSTWTVPSFMSLMSGLYAR